jgi:SecD/SecF fusion protein
MRKLIYLLIIYIGLAVIFNSCKSKNKVINGDYKMVLKMQLDKKSGIADIKNTISIIKKRLLDYGIPEKNINISNIGDNINLEIDQADEPERITKLTSSKGESGFWETYELNDIFSYLVEANKKAAEILKDSILLGDGNKYSKKIEISDDTSTIVSKSKDKIKNKNFINAKEFATYAKENPLFAYLQPEMITDSTGKQVCSKGASIGYADLKDTSRINKTLHIPAVLNCLPKNLKLLWEFKPFDEQNNMIRLIAIKVNRDDKPPINGSMISEATCNYGTTGHKDISIVMNNEGSRIWKRLTSDNVNKSIAIVIDNFVYSYPKVASEIPNGKSTITGNFTDSEAEDMATILKTGMLPSLLLIIESKINSNK